MSLAYNQVWELTSYIPHFLQVGLEVALHQPSDKVCGVIQVVQQMTISVNYKT